MLSMPFHTGCWYVILPQVLSRQNGPARSLPAGVRCSSICWLTVQGGAHSEWC
jgi:hypothetical protein